MIKDDYGLKPVVNTNGKELTRELAAECQAGLLATSAIPQR